MPILPESEPLKVMPLISMDISSSYEAPCIDQPARNTNALDLRLEKVEKIKAVKPTKTISERLEFWYADATSRKYPLKTILGQSYRSLVKIWTLIDRTKDNLDRAYSEDILAKIEEIKESWGTDPEQPRKFKVPHTGRRIHFQPFYCMEYRNVEGKRCCFDVETSLKAVSNEDLRNLMLWLNDEDEEEAYFKRILKR